jgi:hypothetical protein
VTKRTSYRREIIISFCSSSSDSTENVIIAEYVGIAAISRESPKGADVVFLGGVLEESAVDRSRDLNSMEKTSWMDSSDGMMKSDFKTDPESALPVTLLSCWIAALCHTRAFALYASVGLVIDG